VSPATHTPPRPGSIAPTQPAPPRPATRRVWSHVPLDTLALVSASALSRKPLWQALATQLPAGSVLIVTAAGTGNLASLPNIIAAFAARGRSVTTIAVEQLSEQQARLF
jgi:hypothetical protein